MSVSLVSTTDYSKRVVAHINRATRRVYVLSMIIQQNNDASHIITALNRASHRGVYVDVMGDAGTRHFTEDQFSPRSAFRSQVDLTYNITNRLRSSSAQFHWLGKYQPFLFAGRTHAKWIVIDNTVYSFGGINLHQGFTNESDFMLVIADRHLADIIVHEHQSIAHADKTESAYVSASYSCDVGTVLVDGGLPGNSIIYKRATDLISRASDVILVTQYCPTGKIVRALQATPSTVYYNPPGSADFFTNNFIRFGKKLHDIPSRYRGKKYIHAKYLIATLPNGTKEVITGSHNFVSYGEILGTREIAMHSSDRRVIDLVESYHRSHIA